MGKKSYMKKNSLLIIVTLALSLSGMGCNKSGKLDTTSKFTAPSGPVELKLKWPVGERVVQDFDMKMNMEITVPNQPNSIKQNMDMNMGQKYALSVLKENPDGGHEVEMEFLGIRMKLDQGGKTMMEYDSAQKAAHDRKDPMTVTFQKMFQGIVGAKIKFVLDASNRVDRVEGFEEITKQLMAGGPQAANSGMDSMFSEGYFKQIMDGNRYLPSKPVQPGDSWPVQMEVTMGPVGTLQINYTVTFQSWEQHGKRTCARLEFQGTLKSKPDPNSATTGMTMSITDGDTSGVSWFDPELGMIIETVANQNMKMNMTVPANPRAKTPAAAGKTQTITSLMKQEISMKLESVK
jgi:hypothetical protein